MRLGAVLYNDFELLDAYGPLEMFGCLEEAVEIVVIAEQAGPVKSPAVLRPWRNTDSMMRRRWICCCFPAG